MAKYFRFTVLVFALTSLLASCQEGHEAGDLLGMWRMDGSDTNYINFSGRVVEMRVVGSGSVWGHFSRGGDSLYIQCYSINGSVSDTTLVEQTYGFTPFSDIRLRVDRLDDECLVLSKDGKVWMCSLY